MPRTFIFYTISIIEGINVNTSPSSHFKYSSDVNVSVIIQNQLNKKKKSEIRITSVWFSCNKEHFFYYEIKNAFLSHTPLKCRKGHMLREKHIYT